MENAYMVKPQVNHILLPTLVYKRPPFSSYLGGPDHLNIIKYIPLAKNSLYYITFSYAVSVSWRVYG